VGRDRGRQPTLLSEHEPVEEAFAHIDRLVAQMLRTGASGDAVELIVSDDDGAVVRPPGLQQVIYSVRAASILAPPEVRKHDHVWSIGEDVALLACKAEDPHPRAPTQKRDQRDRGVLSAQMESRWRGPERRRADE
jgi:hypothetical protein